MADTVSGGHSEEHGALSPQKSHVSIANDPISSSPYIQSSKSPKKSPHSGGIKSGGHISTMKSLGLLHELQDYITSVEAIAEGQKRELQRVREEKSQIEKAVFRIEVHGEKDAGVDFAHASIADMPPRLRIVFEENKLMKEKLKKYKHKTMGMEAELLKRNNQVVALEDTIGTLKQQLQACSRTPADVANEEALKGKVAVHDRQVKELEHEIAILKQKIEVDAKLVKQSSKTAVLEQEKLKKQLAAAGANLEEKDKELRAALLDVKRLERRLAPKKPPPPPPPSQAPPPHASPSSSSAAGPSLSSQPPPPRQGDRAVHVVILVVKEGAAAPSVEAEATESAEPVAVPPDPASAEEEPTPLPAEESEATSGGDEGGDVPETGEAPPEDAAAALTDAAAAAVSDVAEAGTSEPTGDVPVEASISPEGGDSEKLQHASAPKSVPYSRTAERAAARSQSKDGSGVSGKAAAGKGKVSRTNSNGSNPATAAETAPEELVAAAAPEPPAAEVADALEAVAAEAPLPAQQTEEVGEDPDAADVVPEDVVA